jgi:hypothetical protein
MNQEIYKGQTQCTYRDCSKFENCEQAFTQEDWQKAEDAKKPVVLFVQRPKHCYTKG